LAIVINGVKKSLPSQNLANLLADPCQNGRFFLVLKPIAGNTLLNCSTSTFREGQG
jgi:hypothetical protein